MANPTRRYTYDEDSASAQNLWIVVLFLLAAVGAFLFGRFILGEKLSKNAVPVKNAATAAAPAVADPGGAAPITATPAAPTPNAVSITSGAEAAAPATQPATALDQAVAGAATRPAPTVQDPGLSATQAATAGLAAAGQPGVAAGKTATTRPAKKPKSGGDSATPGKAVTVSETYTPPSSKHTAKTDDEAVKPAGKKTTKKGKAETPPKPAPATEPAGDEEGGRMVRVKAGTYGSQSAAEQRRKELAAHGESAFVRERKSGSHTYYDVQVGAYKSKQKAQQKADELSRKGIDADVSDQ